MYIKNIKLKNFRNYDDLELNFNKNVNLILGKNAQGKTNLIEAIYITSIGKSFRTNKNSDMISFHKDFCKVYVETVKEIFEGSVDITITKDSKKSVKIDDVKINKASELLNNVYVVIFSPEDLKIVKDEPEKRRRFIDRELCQINPAYYDNLSKYNRILKQRNSYLKGDDIDTSLINIFDNQLCEYGSKIIEKRFEFVQKLNEISSGIHKSITDGKENLKIIYSPNVEYKEDLSEQRDIFYEKINKSFNNDMRQRTTTVGPHKDDIEFFIDEINVRNFGSQGQQRTTALSVKLAEINIIKEETGEDAILLLDDVMSELDRTRQEFLIRTLSDVQLFITTSELSEDIIKKFPKGNVYTVQNGNIR